MMETAPGRPTHAAVDASALRQNFSLVRQALTPGTAALAVVKADAYGHGATLVAPLLEAEGADFFGVATLGEALELRQRGIRRPILLLTGARRPDLPALLEHDLTVAVLDEDMARDLAAGLNGRSLRVHVKLDTGMARIGVRPEELPGLLTCLRQEPGLQLEGVFSHFANADRVDREFSDLQVRRFREGIATIRAAGFQPTLCHLANSAGSVARPDAHFDMARPGLVLYGIPPAGLAPLPGLRPAMRLTSRVWQLKKVPAHTPVSYGQTFTTSRPSRLAVVPIGYADGYDRSLSNRGQALVRGRRVPIVGAVCMDLTMFDVTDVPGVETGDEVVLWGEQAGSVIGVDEVGAWQDSSAYEVLTRLGPRVPRVLS